MILVESMDRPVKDKYHYTVPWLGITGGVMAFTQSQYEAVNGFSNEYWGWGCEDDDMFVRIVDSCLHLEQGKYKHCGRPGLCGRSNQDVGGQAHIPTAGLIF